MDEMNLGVEVDLKDPDDFLKCKESLTRIGVASRKDKKLYQSCHILHKRGRYYIVHFKELFILDGKPSTISDDDILRRNLIAHLLCEWGLLSIIYPESVSFRSSMGSVKVLPYHEKDNWNLVSKYTIGIKH